MIDPDALAANCLALCQRKGWSRNWKEGGCYLHLESSEFIEALRGKGDSTPLEEAGDVLFVLFSVMANYGIKPSEAMAALEQKIDQNV